MKFLHGGRSAKLIGGMARPQSFRAHSEPSLSTPPLSPVSEPRNPAKNEQSVISRVNSKTFNLDLPANQRPTDADTVNETTVTSREYSVGSDSALSALRICSVCFLTFRARLPARRRVLSPYYE